MFLRDLSRGRGRSLFKGYIYRFHTGDDLVLLLLTLKEVRSRYGSLENLFTGHYQESNGDVKLSLTRFVDDLYGTALAIGHPGRGMGHFLPSPRKGGACKRLNLFLRWMVRDRDIDLGVWNGIRKSDLIIPLDTHIARIAYCLGLTGRKTADWKTAADITEALKGFDPDDPLKYDFALCHQGIAGICRADRSLCGACSLKGM